MGSKTDEAERRVREQRALIERKVGDLEQRVGDDLSVARERAQHHLAHLPDVFPGGSRVVEQAQDHPMATMAGGIGLGVALGMLGGNERPEDSSDGRSALGAAGGMLSGLGATMMSPLRPYMEEMARDIVQGFADRRQQSATERAREASRPGPS